MEAYSLEICHWALTGLHSSGIQHCKHFCRWQKAAGFNSCEGEVAISNLSKLK